MTASPPPKPHGSLGRDAGIGASVAVLFILLRLFAISHWDWDTAGAVVDTMDFGDAISIVFGTLFAEPALTGLVVMVLLPVTAVTTLWPLERRGIQVSSLLALATYAAVTVALVSTHREWWLPVGMVIVAVLIVLARQLWGHGLGHDVLQWLARSVGVVAVIALMLLAVFVDTPWVVRERIETNSGVIYGYVLATQPGFLRVLTADEREFLIIESGTVTSRAITE